MGGSSDQRDAQMSGRHATGYTASSECETATLVQPQSQAFHPQGWSHTWTAAAARSSAPSRTTWPPTSRRTRMTAASFTSVRAGSGVPPSSTPCRCAPQASDSFTAVECHGGLRDAVHEVSAADRAHTITCRGCILRGVGQLYADPHEYGRCIASSSASRRQTHYGPGSCELIHCMSKVYRVQRNRIRMGVMNVPRNAAHQQCAAACCVVRATACGIGAAEGSIWTDLC